MGEFGRIIVEWSIVLVLFTLMDEVGRWIRSRKHIHEAIEGFLCLPGVGIMGTTICCLFWFAITLFALTR